jgi:hypothetical protein
MISGGKVQVVVRSRRVPTGTVDVREPVYSGSASGILVCTRSNRIVLYDYVLDEDHKRAIEEGRRLSRRLGLELVVVDVSKQGVLRRMLTSLDFGASRGPTLVVAPVCSESETPCSIPWAPPTRAP